MILKTIPAALINEFRNNNVVLFVGAGLSINAGLPSWSELLQLLKGNLISDELDDSFYKECDQMQKAQYLYDNVGKITVINEIRTIFSRVKPNYDIHNMLIPIPLKSIITTNWDNLIEEAYHRNNECTIRLCKDEDISSINTNCKTILKMHGTIDDAASIVFSEDDYYQSFNSNLILKQYLSMIISTSTVLMIGYSYSDFDFKLVFDFIKGRIGKMAKKMYILLLNPSAHHLSYFQYRGLIPIHFNDNSKKKAILNFFDTLNKSVSVWANNATDRLRILSRENGEIIGKPEGLTIRNISSLGPLATPDNPENDLLFRENTALEIECARNWKDILKKDSSTAKYILCLNKLSPSMLVYSPKDYLQHITTLKENLEKYKDKVDVVDSGSPLLMMSNIDIYGEYLCLENIKVDVNTSGYSYLRVYRNRQDITKQIEIFDRTFESIKKSNIKSAMDLFPTDRYMDEEGIINEKTMVYDLVMYRLNEFCEWLTQKIKA